MQTENPFELIFKFLQLILLGTSLDKLIGDFYDIDVKASGNPGVLEKEYDFVIVGAGSAGSTLAGRLSENGNHTVLLLEAGGHQFPLSGLTSFMYLMLGNQAVDWKDNTVPQKLTFQAFINNKAAWSRAKVLGGGSAMNGRLNQRGNPLDFDKWAKEANDSQWEYQNVLPYFKKMEDYHGSFPSDTYHAKGGPIPIYSTTGFFTPLAKEFMAAGKELGYPTTDPNGLQKESFFPFDAMTKNGRSYSTYDCYVKPNIGRQNLKVQTYAHVLKVVFDENEPKKAAGVKFSHLGQNFTVKARKEVIISAGAVGSPQVLLLSGVGPRDHLESLDIPVVIDLPVGKYLQDHLVSYLGPFVFNKDKSSIANEDVNPNMANAERWFKNGTGVFTAVGASIGILSASSVSPLPGLPDVELLPCLSPVSEGFLKTLNKNLNFKPGTLEKYWQKDMGKEAFTIPVILGLPKSAGYLKLKSRNAFEGLEIDPKYLEHPDDLTALLHGLRLAINITKTQAFKTIEAKLLDTPFPGCEQFSDHESDDYLKCFSRHWNMASMHYSSTCRMGADPKTSVVDSHLRVRGLKSLRVVDASIFPNITNANTNTPTIMVAEKAADIIKSEWSKI